MVEVGFFGASFDVVIDNDVIGRRKLVMIDLDEMVKNLNIKIISILRCLDLSYMSVINDVSYQVY